MAEPNGNQRIIGGNLQVSKVFPKQKYFAASTTGKMWVIFLERKRRMA